MYNYLPFICLVKIKLLIYIQLYKFTMRQCDFVSDAVLLGVSEDPLASFTLISPADGVYVADCQASTPLPCPGVHYVERALPIIQDIGWRSILENHENVLP